MKLNHSIFTNAQLLNRVQLFFRQHTNFRPIGISAATKASCQIVEDTRTMCTETPNVFDKKSKRMDRSRYYSGFLQKCVSIKSLAGGKSVHAHIIKDGGELGIYLWNNLVNMYVKCGTIVDARQVFDKMAQKDAVSWTGMIAGYTQNGHSDQALKLFREMLLAGVKPDQLTIASVLPACTHSTALQEGQEIHSFIIRIGFLPDVILESALVDMYAKCRRIQDACKVFEKMFQRDVVSWNAMITGYSQNERCDEALQLFRRMGLAVVNPDTVTIAGVLSACARLAALQYGKEIHSYIVRNEFESDILVGSALIDMYAKCGSLIIARQVFEMMFKRNVVTWNTMIAGYGMHGYGEKAVTLFNQMQQAGVKPDHITFVAVMSACSHAGLVDEGCQYFYCMIQDHCIMPRVEHYACMVDLLGRAGRLNEAYNFMNRMPLEPDASVWGTLLGACQIHCNIELGEHVAEHLFELEPENAGYYVLLSNIYAAAGSSCAILAALREGKQLHADIIKTGYDSHISVGNTLVSFYAKCGSIENACQVFNTMPKKDVVSWNTIIKGYAQHGYGEEALQLFTEMQQTGMKPDCITFVGVLCACSHAGLVDQGCRYFNSMSQDYCLMPSLDHYGCMVDLFGRAGRLVEAEEFINNMPFEPDATVWGALLGACRIHKNLELGKCIAERLLELKPECPATHILLANMYAAAGRWNDAANVRKMMKDKGLKKQPGCSWIEVKNRVHSFLVGDRSHAQTEEIYAMLEGLAGQMKEAGYVPDTNFVLHDVDEEQKKDILSHHSDKRDKRRSHIKILRSGYRPESSDRKELIKG